ncbi:hypothetical protein HYT04_01530 [Candidatus Kaiserbacteria bacterium]|nr:hypothetical protein [Candidatus Kaiserbacteria bacterium]
MKSSLTRLLIWISVCAASLAVYGFWYSAIAGRSAAVADLQSQIDNRMEAAGRVAAARTALAEIAGDESAVQNYFVPETGVVPFIDNLEARALARGTAMKVLSVSVGNSAKKPTLVLSFSIRGTFDAVMRTVGAIEYAPYDISVSRLSLVKEEKSSWNATLELIVGSVPASVATSTREAVRKSVSFHGI